MSKINYTNKQILDFISELESQVSGDAFDVDGLNYWPALRIRIAFSLIEKRYTEKKLPSVMGQFKKAMTLLLRISPKVEHCDVLLVSHKNYQVYVDGQPYDRVLEGYHRDFVEKGVRHCLLELGALRTSYFLPKLSPRIEYVNMFILKVLGCLGSYVFISFRHLNTYTAEVNAKLRDKFDGHSINEKSLITYLSYLRVMKMYFKIYLKRRGIKEVYQATYYDPVGLAINAAANELGIRTYCVQHGGQSRNNPAFGRWSKVPRSGYAMLPATFLCWDKISADNVEEWARLTTYHTARVDGYRWADLWRNNEIEYSGYGNIDKVAKSKFNIIYTMQPSIGNIPDSIIRLIEMFKTEVQFWIRIHPRQFNSSIRQGISEKYAQYTNVNIDEACQLPLPAIMSRMNLHITGFSSSVYEAALFDVMTVFVNKAGCEYFGDLIGEGKATYKESFEELSMFVKQRIVRQVQGDLNYL